MSDIYFKYKTVPYQHQIDAFYKCYPLDYFALFPEMGTGKTKIFIDIASNLYLEHKINAVLLIAPNGVHDQWADEQIPTHSCVPYCTFVWKPCNSQQYGRDLEHFMRDKVDGLKWFCVNVEAFSSKSHLDIFRRFLQLNDAFTCIDEATRIKDPDALRTQNIIQGLSNLTKDGKRVISIEPLSKRRAILTGTMVTNAPYNVWSMFEFLQHNYFGRDFYSFKARYGIEVRMVMPRTSRAYTRNITAGEIHSVRVYASRGMDSEAIARIMKISESSVQYIIDNPKLNAPYKNLNELKDKIATHSFTIRKIDCLDLPPKIYEKVYVDLSEEQKRLYKEMTKELVAQYDDVQLTAANKVTLLCRLQQITGGFFPGHEITMNPETFTYDEGEAKTEPILPNPKLNALLDNLEECSEYPIIIVARYVNEILMLTTEIKKAYPDLRVEVVYGGVTKAARSAIIDDFKRGDVQFLIGNPSVIGTGFNLQLSHTEYIYSNGYSFEEREQFEDRVHRNGQESSHVVYKDFIARNTVDERIYQVLQNKKDLLEFMRDKSIGEFLGEQK